MSRPYRYTAVLVILVFGLFILAQTQRNVRTGESYPFGVDTSLGEYSKFNGPVKGNE